ncbi:DUF5808 domain-containing protein [Paenibacillus sp. YPG26]|uniref:DUF1648 domain-containing protein n=1 Tax=Paenibacillus sp. YPG26 TaxID=2878915 RepID=UPI0020419A14|nr:DUF5808 domain-containing protein [Paenibacillus sp. YPG26]USB33835.1 DUF5808 domain-containing protein [Paenibacillus sp. YPG26]
MYWLSALILILMFAAVSIALIAIPYLTRRTVSFGISVSEEMYYSEPLRRMRRSYAWVTGIIQFLLLAGLAVILFVMNEQALNYALPFYSVLLIASIMLIQRIFYTRMKRYKALQPAVPPAKDRRVIDTSFRQQRLVYPNKWFLIHLVIIAASFLLTWKYYDQAPDTIAMKYSMSGKVIRSVDKSYTAMFFPNIMQVFMLILFFAVNRSIYNNKQQLSPDKAEASVQQNVIFRRKWSMFTLMTGLVMILLFSLIQLSMFQHIRPEVLMPTVLIFPAFILISALIISIQTGQGGSRIGPRPETPGTDVVQDDANWKLGNMYFNAKDPSLFVEKRMGVGWTLNMARPLAWLIFLAPFAIIILIISFLAP